MNVMEKPDALENKTAYICDELNQLVFITNAFKSFVALSVIYYGKALCRYMLMQVFLSVCYVPLILVNSSDDCTNRQKLQRSAGTLYFGTLYFSKKG